MTRTEQWAVVLMLGAVLGGLASSPLCAVDVPARPSPGCAAVKLDTGRELHRTINVDGVSRAYILDVPERIAPGIPVPLLLDFHGFGHSAAGVWNVSAFKALAARDGFITAYPDGLPVHLLNREGAGWEIFTITGNRDLTLVTRLLDDLERTYCIDRARVFATGFSNGAFFSNLLGCAMADRIAAIAPVSGGRITVPCAPARAVPVMIHHGRHDPLVNVEQARQMRDAWVAKNACREQRTDSCERHRGCRDGADVDYCEDDGDHHWPLAATGRIWAFFQAHPLPPQGAP